MGEKLDELCKSHDIFLRALYEEEEIIKNFFVKFNYKY